MEIKTVKRVPCEVYSRIVGYLRPVRDWNVAKQQEFRDRQTYQVPGNVLGGEEMERER